MISECFKDDVARSHILNKIGQVIRHEIKAMCSGSTNSVLQSLDTNDLKKFSWDRVLRELKLHAPVLSDILFSCTKTRFQHRNQTGVVCFIASIMIKQRYRRMNLVQKIISLILYVGHCAKQVIIRFIAYKANNCMPYSYSIIFFSFKVYARQHKLNVSVSHMTLLRLLSSIGTKFDESVIEWRESFIPTLKAFVVRK